MKVKINKSKKEMDLLAEAYEASDKRMYPEEYMHLTQKQVEAYIAGNAAFRGEIACETCNDTGKVMPDDLPSIDDPMSGDLFGFDMRQPCPECRGNNG